MGMINPHYNIISHIHHSDTDSNLPDGERGHEAALRNLADEILSAGGPADLPRDDTSGDITAKATSVATVIAAEVESASAAVSTEHHGGTTVGDTASGLGHPGHVNMDGEQRKTQHEPRTDGEKVATQTATISPLDSAQQHVLGNATAPGSTTDAVADPNFEQQQQPRGNGRHGTDKHSTVLPYGHAEEQQQQQPRATLDETTTTPNVTGGVDDYLERDSRAYEQHRQRMFVEQLEFEERRRELEFQDRKK